jgi:hypothetical protein
VVKLEPDRVQIVVVQEMVAGPYTYVLEPTTPTPEHQPLRGSFRIIGDDIVQLEVRVLSSNDTGESVATDRTWLQLSDDMRTDHAVDLLLHCGDSRYADRDGTIHETFGSARQGFCLRNAQNVFTVGPRDLPSPAWPAHAYKALYWHLLASSVETADATESTDDDAKLWGASSDEDAKLGEEEKSREGSEGSGMTSSMETAEAAESTDDDAKLWEEAKSSGMTCLDTSLRIGKFVVIRPDMCLRTQMTTVPGVTEQAADAVAEALQDALAEGYRPILMLPQPMVFNNRQQSAEGEPARDDLTYTRLLECLTRHDAQPEPMLVVAGGARMYAHTDFTVTRPNSAEKHSFTQVLASGVRTHPRWGGGKLLQRKNSTTRCGYTVETTPVDGPRRKLNYGQVTVPLNGTLYARPVTRVHWGVALSWISGVGVVMALGIVLVLRRRKGG